MMNKSEIIDQILEKINKIELSIDRIISLIRTLRSNQSSEKEDPNLLILIEEAVRSHEELQDQSKEDLRVIRKLIRDWDILK